ncbi:uncharacterized protein RSE6_04878 [Rhynchosporium secalis]|uniref:NIP2 avirulence protein n=1 Tax=Rhynchosporium secalis TaxID=38038 RepID=A0A1E1M6H6_RHYSE|nr:uncharacterized protein RSE6_04878 [Rhynchosporium secalis]
MKYLSILLACVTGTAGFSVVVCAPLDGAKIGDVEWAIQNRRHDLALGGKGFWKGHAVTCNRNAEASVDVVVLCRSDPYLGPHETILERQRKVKCRPSGDDGWPKCDVTC